MPLRSYGVLAGRAIDRRREGAANTPHYQIHLVDDAGTAYRAAVNVLSQQAPSELLYLADDDFRHPVLDQLPAAGSGWTALTSAAGSGALDFVRGNLFDPAAMRPLPPDLPGDDNDLADLLDHYVRRAVNDESAAVYVFGERWGPEAATRDKVFGFLPGNGVHDVHMNQGNSGRFQADDGVWQDGALLIHLPDQARWIGVFLAFQSQSWRTDDVTGHALDGAPPRPGGGEEPVRILAALVNPAGPAPERERVILLNASPAPIGLDGWRLADGQRRTLALSGTLDAGATLSVALDERIVLGNRGGTLSLLDAAGLKVHGVGYTAAQAAREGWTITFP
ncbi:hypothetical protein Misp01_18340 [Microtetraspora sp. NBRC 13810]|uniref:DUF2278 family protein n=1 Tax=Microtetraspora sp. NBRC 13810 TaxID=3030990 RepID=UPI0024A3CE0C|nr:DUF2278 family protein [Microtetraspora sp. NBRC 13810]GLW06704.1 hypothetical protein Misp01_18340 [Microtetraspora sp. NBRC 13810]